jgi:hypothetical protein
MAVIIRATSGATKTRQPIQYTKKIKMLSPEVRVNKITTATGIKTQPRLVWKAARPETARPRVTQADNAITSALRPSARDHPRKIQRQSTGALKFMFLPDYLKDFEINK